MSGDSIGGMYRVVFVLLFIYGTCCAEENNWWRNTRRLHDDLLIKANYSSGVNPQPNQNHTTNVHFNLAVRALWIDDLTQILTLNAWFIMYWADHRLSWDSKDYGQLTDTTFGKQEVWTPDLTVYNSADPTDLQHYGDVPVWAHSSGILVWVPPTTTKTECPMDLTYWPFDEHKCYIYMGSWTTNGLQIDYKPGKPNMTVEELLSHMIKTSHHWTVKHISLHREVTIYPCCPEPYIMLIVELTLARYSPFFTATVFIPAIGIALLTLVQFVLPVDYPPRVTVGVASALLNLIMLINLSATLPPLGDSCPIIVKYYATTLLMTVLSLASSGVMARLVQEQPEVLSIPPPGFIKSVLTGPLATVLCIRSIASKVGRGGMMTEDNEEEVLADKKSFQHEWLLVATAVDRVVAAFFVVFFFFLIVVFSSI